MALRRVNNLIKFRDARWTAFDTIECMVTLDETGEEVPFNATPDDPMDYGRELFEMLSGPQAAQVEVCTPEEKYTVFAGMARAERNRLLKDTDWTQLPDVPELLKNVFAVYRQELRDLPESEGFPFNVVFPTIPGGASRY